MSGSIFQGFEEQLNQTAEDILPYYWKNNSNGRHEYYKLFLMNLTSLFIPLMRESFHFDRLWNVEFGVEYRMIFVVVFQLRLNFGGCY